ncbi:hypothetical protein QO034_17360 [Sedimentitalea sp. JM2-8]|uniref:Uncharacterized protein n=1 Tax=Sedimentitalea xiamensis TaxID=3050037 RepID=A0ABT7FI96_9RHOB|nr:hypothetical protein [Sedimentitalea xiamensis]MDK3074859.1 hypothetical protein [Sedimentitalea xiamensis]
MKTGLFGVALPGFAMFATALWAQALPPLSRPAEMPPATFTGSQYVDSKGCAFRRATVDGHVTWAARMTGARQQVCGLPPSVAPEGMAVDAAIRAGAPKQAGVRPASPVRAAQGQRRKSRNASVLRGYRPVWKDDRLNPSRGKTNPVPVAGAFDLAPPGGYVPVWRDGRLNPRRGPRPVQREAGRAGPRAPAASDPVRSAAAQVNRISTRPGSPGKMPRADR